MTGTVLPAAAVTPKKAPGRAKPKRWTITAPRKFSTTLGAMPSSARRRLNFRLPSFCALVPRIPLPIIPPGSRVRMYWDALIFLAVFYNCNATPILLATPPRDRITVRNLGAIDTAIDILFVVDTMTGFIYGFIDEDTKEVVVDQKAIGDMYLASWRFKINLVAISPLLTLPRGQWPGVCRLAFPRRDGGSKNRRISRLFCFQFAKLIRVLRMLLINSQLSAVRDFLEYMEIVKLNEPMYRMLQITCYLTFSLSVFGSFYFWLACNNVASNATPWCSYGTSEHKQNDKWINGTFVTDRKRAPSEIKTWVENDIVFQEVSHTWSDVVGRLLHFMAQTFFTIGYGDSPAPVSLVEIRYMVFVMFVGAFSYALVIANMTSVLANSNVLQARHDDEIAKMHALIKNRDLPEGLRRRIKGSFEYIWNKQSGMSDRQLTSEIPPKLRELVSAQQIQMVLRVPFFSSKNRGGSDEFATKIAGALDPRVYIPNSTVAYAHEKFFNREMLIVRVGSLLIFSKKNRTEPLEELGAGEFIGDFQLLFDVQHPVCVKSSNGFTEIFALDYPNFKRCCDECHVVISEEDKGVVQMTDAYQTRLNKWVDLKKQAAAAEAEKILLLEEEEGASSSHVVVAAPLDHHHHLDDDVTKKKTFAPLNHLDESKTAVLKPAPLNNNKLADESKTSQQSLDDESSDDDDDDASVSTTASRASMSSRPSSAPPVRRTTSGGTTLASSVVRRGSTGKILPQSRFHGFWEPLLILLVLYQNIMYPLRLVLYTSLWRTGEFQSNARCLTGDRTLFVDLFVVDVFFLVEMFLRSHYFAYQDLVLRQVTVISDSKSIRSRYLTSFRFKVDCLTCFPWIIFAPALAPKSAMGCLWFAALRYPHQLRFINLVSYVEDYRRYLEHKYNVVLTEKFVVVSRRAYETFTILIAMASFWAVIRGFGDGNTVSFRRRFSEALYFAIVTFSTVGYGDITPETPSETWFSVCGSIFGPCFFAAIVANVTGFIHSTDISEDNILHKRAVLETFIEERELTSETAKLVMAYFDYIETEKGGVDEIKMLRKDLPTNISDDVLLYLTHRLVLGCRVFRGCEAGFLRQLMLTLEQRFYSTREFVVFQGRPVDGMSFVGAGSVDVYVDGEKVSTLATNGFFAEEAILANVTQMPYSVQCAAYNEQWFLSRTAFMLMMPSFPLVEAKRPDMVRRVRRYKKSSGQIIPPIIIGCSPPPPSSAESIHHLRGGVAGDKGSCFHVDPVDRDDNGSFNSSVASRVSRTDIFVISRGSNTEELTDSGRSRASNTELTEDNSLRGRSSTPIGPRPPSAEEEPLAPKLYLVVAPEGPFMNVWHHVLLFFNSYNFLFIPLRAVYFAGYDFRSTTILLMVVDYIGDLVFLADMVLSSKFLAHYDGEFLVTAKSRIWLKYYRGSNWEFPIHFFASLPLDLLYFANVGNMRLLAVSRVQYLAIFRVNRLARVVFLGDHWFGCERALQSWGVRFHKNGLRMFKLVLAMLLAAHIFGCAFFFIAAQKGNLGQCALYKRPRRGKYCKNWAMDNNLLNVAWHQVRFEDVLGVSNSTDDTFGVWGSKYRADDVRYDLAKNRLLWRQYVTSLYWGFATITTVGYGDISASSLSEMQFNIVCLFVSVSMYTIIIANMEDIVAQLDVTLTLYSLKREKVKQYCMRSYLPDSMQTSINDYYDKLWTQQKGVSGTDVLNMLPRNLRSRVVRELTGRMLTDTFFVRDRGKTFVDELCCILKLDLFMPKDFLFRAGECASAIFFVFFGSVQLIDEQSKQVYSILEHAGLGEAEFFSRVLYPVTAQTTDYSQIFTLHFADFELLLRRHGALREFRDYVVEHHEELQKIALDKLKETMIPNLKHPKISKMFHGVITTEKQAKNMKRSGFIKLPLIDPSSLVKRLWMMACLSGALYFLISVPYEIAYARHFRREVFGVDIFYLILYVADIALNLTTFMVKKQGKLITDPEHFREIYVSSYLANDLLGLLPVSTLAALALPAEQRFKKRYYSPLLNVFRLFQVLRVKQIGLYFSSLYAFVEDFFQFHLDSDIAFLLMIGIIILLICHWMAALYYVLGRYELYIANNEVNPRWFKDDALGCREYNAGRANPNIWICMDEAIFGGPSLHRWLYSFYWSVYTCMTIGYGALSVASNAEKLLCSFAMIVGAVCCDAGVTASLSSYIEHMDHQAGTNKRRMVCCQSMLRAAEVTEPMIDRLCAFFNYVDHELCNLDESAILMELNTAMRNSILHRAALLKMCDSLMYGGFEAGIVATMVSQMRIVVAVPMERVLQIGQPDPSLFIFQSGVAHSVDGCGDEEFIANGTILSNVEFKQVAKRVGVPTKQLVVRIVEARGLPMQHSSASTMLLGKSVCNPYVELVIVSKTVFGSSTKTCQTKIRKYTTAPLYSERFKLKAYQNTDNARFVAYHWRRGLAGKTLGSCDVAVKDKMNAKPRWHKLYDDKKRVIGELKLSVEFNALSRSEIANTAELTVIADSFCHLYKLDFKAQTVVSSYIKGMRLPIAKRLQNLTDEPKSSGAKHYRPTEEDFAQMTNGDTTDISLCSSAKTPNARGFDAYMAETFFANGGSSGGPSGGRPRAAVHAPNPPPGSSPHGHHHGHHHYHHHHHKKHNDLLLESAAPSLSSIGSLSSPRRNSSSTQRVAPLQSPTSSPIKRDH